METLDKVIGEGMYAIVSLASETTVRKTLRRYRFQSVAELDAAFAREAAGCELMSKLGIGPELVSVRWRDYSVELELLQGKTLSQLTDATAIAVCKRLAMLQLSKLHAAGYTHNDLHKHDNVFVTYDKPGIVRLLDGGMVARPGELLPDGRTANAFDMDTL